MASKTITITEDAYEKLAAHKREDESFSEVIRRLTGTRKDPTESVGSYPGLGDAFEAARADLDAGLRRGP